LEQTVIDTLKCFQINSDRSSLNAGVWIDNKKISAQGITASRWITLHGVAFNVNTDLDRYNKIIPCGLDPSVAGVCSLQSLSGEKQEWNLAGVSEQWLKSISNVFNLQLDFVKNPEEILSKLSFSEPMHLERVTAPIVE
jgi:lipoyl(octanoyl) transferase